MDINKAFQIATCVAAEPLPPKSAPNASPSLFPEIVEQGGKTLHAPAPSISEALSLVRSITEGHSTAQDAPLFKEAVSALCVVVAHLAGEPELGNEPTIISEVSSARGPMSLDDYLREIERREVLLALEAAGRNVAEAARLLGVSYRSLRYRLENLGIE